MNKYLTGLAVISLTLAGIVYFSGNAEAYQGDPSIKGPYYSEDRHQAMEKAFETNNYEAWKNLMQNNGKVSKVITKENFSKMAQAHELAEQGKLDEARKIRQELGLGLGLGKGMGYRIHR